MSGRSKQKLDVAEGVAGDEREVFLREGRTLTVSDQGADQLVEIRSESGMLELRIRLTEQGPVLQMESVRLELKAAESVSIESKAIQIAATETLSLGGSEVKIAGHGDVKVDAGGEVRVVGTMIYLN